MQIYEARLAAISAAANLSADGVTVYRKDTNAAIRFLIGETDKAAFVRACADCPIYARLIIYSANANSDEFTTEKLCALHKFVYESRPDGGEIRTSELSMQGGSCTTPSLLRGSLKNVLAKMNKMQSAPALSKADFAAELCCYVRELIILSPFSCGNGIVRRAFIQNFCRSRGFTLTYASAPKSEIIEAENAAFAGDDPEPLFTLYLKCLNYYQESAPADRRRAPAVKRDTMPAKGEDVADALSELSEIRESLISYAERIDRIIASLKGNK